MLGAMQVRRSGLSIAAAALALALLGCNQGKAKDAGVPCDTAASVFAAHHATALNVGEQLPAYARGLSALCIKRAWPATVRACVKASTDAATSEACFTEHGELTQIGDAIQQIRGQLAMSGSPPPPPTTPPTPTTPQPTPQPTPPASPPSTTPSAPSPSSPPPPAPN